MRRNATRQRTPNCVSIIFYYTFLQMSFSGRLNNLSSQNSNNVVPLSISKSDEDKFNLPQVLHNGAGALDEEQRQVLVEDWITCKNQLLEQSRTMKQLKEAHEVQLVSLSRQLLELECGLRKRERELCSILKQRDQVIREQNGIIQFLTKKTGNKGSTDIVSLADEAAAKIPQWNNADKKETGVTESASSNEVALASILESESENDSAVIIDDLSSPKR